MYGQFNTYIDNPKMINKLLCFDWIILKDKWTNCPQELYDRIKKESLMKNYKPTDPEMVQAQKDLAELSNLSDRVISNDKDLFEELATIQRKLCEISELKSHFLQRYEDILDEQHRLETQLCVFQHEMLHSFELVFRYYKTKKKGFK